MRAIRDLFARLPVDPYLLMLLGTVALAFVLPARGEARPMADGGVYGAVSALFFLYGARLSPAAVWAGLAHWRLQSLVFASTFIVFPLVGLAVGTLARPFLPTEITTGLIFLCLLPSTVQSSIAFTSIARGNVPAALCSASLSNLLGVVMTPLLVSLVFPVKGGPSPSSIGDIALQIVLPFALGQLARRWIGAWLLRKPALTAAFDRGSILLIVYAAFSAGVVAGVWRKLSLGGLASVTFLDVVVLGLVIAFTTVASRGLGFSTEDEISIVFCGSKKSMAAGIPMANILFPGHGVALIVLPLMIFHQAQLFVCATLARRYARRAQQGATPDVRSAIPTAPLGGGA
jgi:sodium/bile acid cotransporter 7